MELVRVIRPCILIVAVSKGIVSEGISSTILQIYPEVFILVAAASHDVNKQDDLSGLLADLVAVLDILRP